MCVLFCLASSLWPLTAAATPDATDTPDTANAPSDAPDTSSISDASDVSDTSDVSGSPDVSDVSDSSDTSAPSDVDDADATDVTDTRIPDPTITSFTLIDAENDTPVSVYDPIPPGAVINLAKLPSSAINIRANTVPPEVGSVRFDLGEMGTVNVDDTAPYAMMGDENGDYAAWRPDPGTYDLQAKAFSEAGAEGIPGRIRRLQFELVDAPDKNAMPAVVIEAPERGARKRAPATFQVRVKAADIDGTVERVDLGVTPGPTASTVKRNGRWHGEIGTLPEGSHRIEAVARDDDGDIGIGKVRVRVLPGTGMDTGGGDGDTAVPDADGGSEVADGGDLADGGEDVADGDDAEATDTGGGSPREDGCRCSTAGSAGVDTSLVVIILLMILVRTRRD